MQESLKPLLEYFYQEPVAYAKYSISRDTESTLSLLCYDSKGQRILCGRSISNDNILITEFRRCRTPLLQHKRKTYVLLFSESSDE